MANAFVYILTTKNNKIYYIGVTTNLEQRIYAHKTDYFKGFTCKYNIKKLVYYEELESIHDAIEREKQLKRWHRTWKTNLITKHNPHMQDLAEGLDAENNSNI